MPLLNRTTLSFVLLACMGVDFLLLHSERLHVPLTAVQSLLLLVVLAIATRREPAAPGQTVRPRTAVAATYLLGLAAVALLALAEKWWIALRVDLAVRLTYASSYRVMGATLTFAGVALMLGGGKRLPRYFAVFAEQPARQTALSFVALALFGAFLLTLPICVRDPTHVSFLDALFMATSAVCVTGLGVHGVTSEYTPWGQGVLLALVQVGGLGMMVLSASLIVLTGRKLRARSSAVLAEVIDADSVASLQGSIRRIVLFTLSIEALGAVLLFATLSRHPEATRALTGNDTLADPMALAWAAAFHAVSAFCNAGFTLTSDNLVPFARSYDVCVVLMALIVLGGLGFPVLSELSGYILQRLRRQRPPRVSLHARTVLTITGFLIIAVAVVLGAVEWSEALAGQHWFDRAFSALFQSVTLRTAGFNTVALGALSNAGLMICMMFMFVGAAPGGTGGGVKVTTFAVLFAILRSELRGADEPSLFDRRLPPGTVRRAISVAFVSVVVLTLVVLLLLVFEEADALHLAFEAVSAFGTVGLSVDLTPRLGSIGKFIIIVTMLIGRVGPLTVVLAVSQRRQRAHRHHPHERVLIG